MAACWSLIDFEATDPPPWMEREDASGVANPNRVPSVSDMIKDIIGFQERWAKLPEKDQQETLLVLVPTFVHHICVEEDLGLQDKADTRALYHNMQKDIMEFKTKPDEKKNVQHKFSDSNSVSKKKMETVNLFFAWEHLWMVDDTTSKDSNSLTGLVDIDECILETHKIIMNDLVINSNQTPGGIFSTERRYTTYKGERHEYPHFETTEKAREAVQLICDQCNALMDEIKKLEDPYDRMYKLFKCGAWLLFNLVSLHPFSDGNGRLCRLLCSFALAVATPFPSPIYNVYSSTQKSDYIDGIVSAQKREPQHPMELTTLIIESNWCAWKSVFKQNASYGLNGDNPVAEGTECEDEPMPAAAECEQNSV